LAASIREVVLKMSKRLVSFVSQSWCKESLLLHILIQSLLFAQKKTRTAHMQLPASQIRHHLPTQNLVVVTKQAAKDSLIPTGQIKANN
jgi:hypothetical protein